MYFNLKTFFDKTIFRCDCYFKFLLGLKIKYLSTVYFVIGQEFQLLDLLKNLPTPRLFPFSSSHLTLPLLLSPEFMFSGNLLGDFTDLAP